LRSRPLIESKHEIASIKSDLLNLGCGSTYHLDWDNFDLVPSHDSIRPIDLLKKLPFRDASYGFCYSSHVLEHMPRSQAPIFLKEMYRILRPGGVVRIVVPDLEGIVRRYLHELESVVSGDESAHARHEWMLIELLDQLTRTFSGGFMGRLWHSRPLASRSLIEDRLGNEARKWLQKLDNDFLRGAIPISPQQIFDAPASSPEEEASFRNKGEIHRWMYDHVSLGRLLREAGFHQIERCESRKSWLPDFHTYLLDTDRDGVVRKPDSLFMEAIKPKS
jgi:predicted SAM-dependent methyltransferase